MVQPIEDFLNSMSAWYEFPALFLGIGCAYNIVWSFNDGGMFGSTFYRWKMIRGFGGLLCCLTVVGWPVVLIWFITRAILIHVRNGPTSEWDEMVLFEKNWSDRWSVFSAGRSKEAPKT